ncbi:MAG: hypothetical protein FJ304_18045 [Planctomycetes bacterium]|nr:hypothetical protein [Planctomycetota bacterium]
MRYALLLCALVACLPARAGDDQDRFEEQAAMRAANNRVERSMRTERGERAMWLKDLEVAYPGKVPANPPDDAEAWFALLAGGGDEWRKSDASAAGVGVLYERVVQRMELGPVPTIKRDEFARYVKMLGRNVPPVAGKEVSTDDEADKVFRVLDLNADDELTGNELTPGLREGKGRSDSDGNGRISKEEYRDYFKRRVDTKSDALMSAYKTNDKLMRNLYGGGVVPKVGGAIPAWFNTLDTDKDNQVSLFEWREGGKPTSEFMEMDLNGDGLLTRNEYLRSVKLKDMTAEEKRRETGRP